MFMKASINIQILEFKRPEKMDYIVLMWLCDSSFKSAF